MISCKAGKDVDWRQAFTGRYNNFMKLKRRTCFNARPGRWYRGADIPMRVIRRYARQVAERFEPDKIILFGSYAYGTPHADSDVDWSSCRRGTSSISRLMGVNSLRPWPVVYAVGGAFSYTGLSFLLVLGFAKNE